MPAACTNCVRFHYGPCEELQKQCYKCDGWNHIERYCPSHTGRVIVRTDGEPLPGTRSWCDLHGLSDDPELKSRVLQALKTDPGSAIDVNGIRIYTGIVKKISTKVRSDEPRGRTLEEHTVKYRSRSLSPKEVKFRPESPARRSGALSSPRGTPGYQRRYRSRSPIRQRRGTMPNNEHQGQPRNLSAHGHSQYRARSRRNEPGSNAVVFDAWNREPEDHRINMSLAQIAGELRRLNPAMFNFPNPLPSSVILPPGPQGWAPLNPVIFGGTPAYYAQPEFASHAAFNAPYAPLHAFQPTAQSGRMVYAEEDPYYVLGIASGACAAVILHVHQKKVQEVELARGRVPDVICNRDIERLNAAKRQLLGY